MSAADFLNRYAIGANAYWVNQHQPISMRDQVVRANYLVRALVDAGRLEAESTVLIIGAGVCGSALALSITQWATLMGHAGVRVTLVDAAPSAMSLQERGGDRWIDPVEYDWPAAHWDHGQWPIGHPFTKPITSEALLRATTSAQLARDLQQMLKQSKVVPKFEHRYKGFKKGGDGAWNVTLLDLKMGSVIHESAQIVVAACGFGGERHELDTPTRGTKFRSPAYWSADAFLTPEAGIAPVDNLPIIVSGAGDGGLQDWIRLVTGKKTPAEVWVAVEGVLGEFKEQFEGAWHWEQQLIKARSFTSGMVTDCSLYRRLHEVYTQVVDAIVASSRWEAVTLALSSLLADRTLSRSVYLYTSGDHFHSCFALNRAVALLLLAYFKDQGEDLWADGRAPMSIDACTDDHHGTDPDAGCWGQHHHVQVAVGTSCGIYGADLENWGGRRKTIEVRGIVLRHGLSESRFDKLVSKPLVADPVPMDLYADR